MYKLYTYTYIYSHAHTRTHTYTQICSCMRYGIIIILIFAYDYLQCGFYLFGLTMFLLNMNDGQIGTNEALLAVGGE
ncbi:hypothetical protein EON63_07655 [archaeon]|nr:MAG: hypothetical protein EON63_07655 [archaeon]